MNKIVTIVSVSIVFLASCSPKQPTKTETPSWHIFRADEAKIIAMQCSRPSPGPISDTWQPTDALLERIEGDLRTLLQEKIEGNYFPVNANASEYSFQIAGLIIDGQKVLYINGIRTGFIYEDLSKPFGICDGGAVCPFSNG